MSRTGVPVTIMSGRPRTGTDRPSAPRVGGPTWDEVHSTCTFVKAGRQPSPARRRREPVSPAMASITFLAPSLAKLSCPTPLNSALPTQAIETQCGPIQSSQVRGMPHRMHRTASNCIRRLLTAGNNEGPPALRADMGALSSSGEPRLMMMHCTRPVGGFWLLFSGLTAPKCGSCTVHGYIAAPRRRLERLERLV